jgi:nucleotide-binding universal stress UspA family protein
METILVPVDFSSVTVDVIDEAIRIAPSLDAKVVLFSVVQPPRQAAAFDGLGTELAGILAAEEAAVGRKLVALQERLQQEYIPAEVVKVVGDPVERICAEADRLDANYVIMGSHGHTAFYDLLVGSTTAAVLKRANCPVIVVPSHSRAGKAAHAKTQKPAVP